MVDPQASRFDELGGETLAQLKILGAGALGVVTHKRK